jgi:hypothetical protein
MVDGQVLLLPLKLNMAGVAFPRLRVEIIILASHGGELGRVLEIHCVVRDVASPFLNVFMASLNTAALCCLLHGVI